MSDMSEDLLDDMSLDDLEYDSDGLIMEDDYGDDGFDVGDGAMDLVKHTSYEVLTERELEDFSKSMIEETMDILAVPSRAITTVLLREYEWNKERLVDEYMENPEKVQKSAGISSFKEEKKASRKKKYECLICMERVTGRETFALACGHRYCLGCWKTYLEIKIMDREAVYTECPSPKCKEIVHENAYKKIVGKQAYKDYKKLLFRSLVADNPLIKWCPAPDCTNCIKCERKNRKEAVVCACKFRFCFMCADSEIGDHMPATCDDIQQWNLKSQDESENVKWMIANTKKCPKCRSPIEKNGGCMHMTCRRDAGGCGYEFCWLCRGAWSEHGADTGGYYACNKYDASTAKKEDVKAADVKTELETYMFYYHRFESHKSAGKIADEQRKLAQNRSEEVLERYSVRAQDTKFLVEATEQLIENRRVLQWSYVFGFYLDKSKEAEKNLFEYLQEDLEKHTNHLSELYEMPLSKIPDYHAFMKWKEDVTNYTRITSKFLDKFVQGVSDGLTHSTGNTTM